MPIFEYTCSQCGHCFESLILSKEGLDKVSCPNCESRSVDKQLSVFSPSVAAHPSYPPRCDTSGECETPNVPGCKTGMCGLT